MAGVTSSLPSLESSLASSQSEKPFIVGPGHAPIPSQLVSKIIGDQFVELADLLSVNLREVEQEPQTFLNGKLVVSSSKRGQVEIKDILTWTEAFTIFRWCCARLTLIVGPISPSISCLSFKRLVIFLVQPG